MKTTPADTGEFNDLKACIPILREALSREEALAVFNAMASQVEALIAECDALHANRHAREDVISGLKDTIESLTDTIEAAQAAQAASQEPNADEVICPNCCNQFRAIPVNVQRLLLDAGVEPPFI